MKLRPSLLAWTLFSVNLAGIVATSIIANFVEGLSDALNLVTFGFFVIACAVLGALVAAKRPNNAIGWILSLIATFGVVAGVVSAYIEANPTEVGSPGNIADWVGSFIWTLAFAPMIFVVQLFPTGRPLGPRWVPVLWLTGVGVACAVISYGFAPGPMENSIDPVLNPFGIESLRAQLRVLSAIGGVLTVCAVVLAVGSLILRFRRSANVERQQIKWFAYAGIVILGALVVQMAVFSIVPESDTAIDVSNALFSLTVTLIPITIGIAVLRYRLYDDSPVIVAGSTLAVVAAFGPLRTRFQTLVDKRFNRNRYDADRTIAEFSGRLRAELELDSLTDDLVGVVETTLQPSHLSIWLARETLGEERR